jgi:hypothetical protein
VSSLDQSVAGTLAFDLARLRRGLAARSVRMEDLPPDLRERWIGTRGSYRVQVVPARKLETSEEMAAFLDRVRSEAPELTGVPVHSLESARVAVRAFWRALGLALLATLLSLLLVLRSVKETALAVAPVLVAALLTFGAAGALDLPMNFGNIIALPLLLGIGVDNGIHIVHRAGRALPPGTGFYGTSTARAVLVATLTTIASFGIMSASGHRGLASMGQLLSIGMLALLFSTMVLLPSLLPGPRGEAECTPP